jgi:hypothetical protein
MKVKVRISLLLILLCLGFWIYCANKFESLVKEEIIPVIANHPALIKTDLDNIQINKYRFSLILKEVDILPLSASFIVKTDELTLKYNPLTSKIIGSFTGQKLITGSGKTRLYIPKPQERVEFSQSLIGLMLKQWNADSIIQNLENIKVTLYSPQGKLYYVPELADTGAEQNNNIALTEEQLISEYQDGELHLQINNDGNYQLLSITDQSKQRLVRAKLFNEYTKNLVHNILPSNVHQSYKTEDGTGHVSMNFDRLSMVDDHKLVTLLEKINESNGLVISRV